MSFQTLLLVLDLFELGLTVGASTLALTFYFMALKDGVVDPSERRLMGAVYFMLRLSLLIIIMTEVFYVFYFGFEVFTLVQTMSVYWFRWFLMGIIIGNALLMDAHKMPMWLGPALAGGSWYALFFATVWPNLTLPFVTLTIYWAIGIAVMALLLRVIGYIYLPREGR